MHVLQENYQLVIYDISGNDVQTHSNQSQPENVMAKQEDDDNNWRCCCHHSFAYNIGCHWRHLILDDVTLGALSIANLVHFYTHALNYSIQVKNCL